MKLLLDGVDVSPVELDDIDIGIDKSQIEDVLTVGTSRVTFANEGIDVLRNAIANNGYFKGVPLQLKLNNGFTLDYFVDPTDGIRIQDHKIEASIRQRYENHRFWEQVDSVSFDLLANWGVTFDYKNVKRIVQRTDIETQALLLVIFGNQLHQFATSIADEADRVANDVLNGVGIDVSDIAYAVALGLLIIAKIALMVLAIVALVNAAIDLFFPKSRNLPAPQIKSLIVNGCNYLGYTVQSSLLDEISDWHFLGRPVNQAVQSIFQSIINPNQNVSTKPYPTISDTYEGMENDITFLGGMLRWIVDVCNARVNVINGTVYIERRDVKQNITQGVTTGLTIQGAGVSEFSPNTDEAWQRFLLQFPVDPSDRYTSDLFDDSVVEYASVNNNTNLPDLNLIKGVRRVNVGLSYGFRKTKGMWINKAIEDLFAFGTALGKSTGIGVNPFPKISEKLAEWKAKSSPDNAENARLVTSDYFFSRPKLLVLDVNGNIKPDWKDKIGAEALFKKYHEIDFIGNNSFMIHRGEITECTNEIFVNLQNNDFAEINGEICEVLNVRYNEFQNKAEISYKRPSDYANNVNLIKVA